MYHPTDWIAHTSALLIPVVEHWLETNYKETHKVFFLANPEPIVFLFVKYDVPLFNPLNIFNPLKFCNSKLQNCS